MPRFFPPAAAILLLLLLPLYAADPAGTQPASPAEPIKLDGIVNSFKLTDRIYSGSKPEGDAGFAALEKLGIKTVICVDGITPDADAAKRHGMRYVHLPVGYDGITRDEALSIARAVRDLPGPVYLHCHHGQIRGPSAAGIAAVCDAGWTNAQAVAFLAQVGTPAHYKGIIASVKDMAPPSKDQLDKADNSFPAAAKLEPLTAAMVKIDARMDHIKAAAKAGWKAPPGAPEMNPADEALQLHELLHEVSRGDRAADSPDDFKQWISHADDASGKLEAALRDNNPAGADLAVKSLGKNCGDCHDAYRDGAN